MACLLDTGILLRLANREDAAHPNVLAAVEILGASERLVGTSQNVAEYFNVATRPRDANGLGQTPEVALDALRISIEPLCKVFREHSKHYGELKRLLRRHRVCGKQVT